MAMSRPVYTTEEGRPVHAVMAEFPTPGALHHAAERVRDAGYRRWDVYSPFPVHGMEDAMGLRPTKLPLIVATCAFVGAGLGLLMQWWMTGVDYPLMVQGKPFAAWEPFTPVTFELGVLSAAFATLLGMLAMNALPMWHHPLLKKERFLRVSDDRYLIVIEAADEKFDPDATRRLLDGAGAVAVEVVEA